MNSTIRTEKGRLWLGSAPILLLSGEIQFWRMNPDQWAPALESARAMGFTIVSTYLSWRRHQPAPDQFEWGEMVPQLDVRAFIESCAENGLRVQIKPGPWICAEEPGGGYPDWLLENDDIIALDAQGKHVIGYNPPFRHPVPCYRHPQYRQAVRRWFDSVWNKIGDLCYPTGPIVAVQLDNEPSHCFRDGLYESDYHPLQLTAWREWLVARYPDQNAFRAAWGASCDIATASPARPGDTPSEVPSGRTGAVDQQTRDWIDFSGDSILEHLRFLARCHAESGAEALLPTVNIVNPPVFEVPLAHNAVHTVPRGVVGTDHYYEPPLDLRDIDRLAKTAALARLAGEPLVWAPELMCGIWRSPGEVVRYPDPTPIEQIAWWGAAIALGYQGLNLYMLADRQNWQFAPVSTAPDAQPFYDASARFVALLAQHPDIVTATPVAATFLAWYRSDAVAGYAGRPEPYRAWDQTAFELLARGLPYQLVDSDDPVPPPRRGAVLLVPPKCSFSKDEKLTAVGWTVTRLDSATTLEVLDDAGLLKRPVEISTSGSSHVLITVTESCDYLYLHLVNWGVECSARVGLRDDFPIHEWTWLTTGSVVDLGNVVIPAGYTVMAHRFDS